MDFTPRLSSLRDKDTHRWADFWELEALLGERPVPEEAFKRRISNLKTSLKPRSINTIASNSREMLRSRQTIYARNYPFHIQEDIGFSLANPDSFSPKQSLYLYLLLTTGHDWLHHDQIRLTSELTSIFEVAACLAVRAYLGGGPGVKSDVFGTSSPRFSGYRGLSGFANRLTKLALDLDDQFNEQEPVDEDDNDGGLDVFACRLFVGEQGAKVNNAVIITGQAKCNTKWHKFLSSADPLNQYMKRFITPGLNAVPCMIIPYDYRKPGNAWFNPGHANGALLLDRHRLFRLLENEAERLDKLLEHFYSDLYAALRSRVPAI